MITVDQDIRSADNADNHSAVQVAGVKIPSGSILTRVTAIPKVASNLSTHLVNVWLNSNNGIANGADLNASGTRIEILGAQASGAAEDFTSTSADETKQDIDLKNAVKEVYMNENIIKVAVDSYLYVGKDGS